MRDFFKADLAARKCLWIDLLSPETEREFLLHPSKILAIANPASSIEWVVIDEVQRLPALLDVAHRGISEFKLKFALTGSSARKLRRGAANLLAGRAITYHLFPLSHRELGPAFKLEQALAFGSLPDSVAAPDDGERVRFLRSYATTYLREEIQAEQIVRNMEPFRLFLEVAAQASGQVLNYSRLAREAGIDTKSCERYFHILEDTLVGFFLPAYHRSVRKQQLKAPKFYFVDNGIHRALTHTVDLPLRPQTYDFGRAFEQWLVAEVFKLNHYHETDYKLAYLRTKDNVEIDLILAKPGRETLLIEIKSGARVTRDDTKSLRLIGGEFKNKRLLVLSMEARARREEGIEIYPWEEGLREIFGAIG